MLCTFDMNLFLWTKLYQTANRRIPWNSVRRFFVFCLFILMEYAPLYPIQSPYHFTRISREQGLSENNVTAILQDKKGFLWIGTANGLNRYDGYTFTNFHHDPADPHSISSNIIRTIYEDHSGFLWIGTANGLNKFNHFTGHFSAIKHDSSKKNSLSHNDVTALYEDTEGFLWVGTKRGLNRFDPQKNLFKLLKSNKKKLQSISDNDITVIYADNNDRRLKKMWVGTRNGGLNLFDQQNWKFGRFTTENDYPTKLRDNGITSINSDQAGTLWVGTRNGGLHEVKSSPNGYVVSEIFAGEPTLHLSDTYIRSIIIDNTGKRWIGTRNGLNIVAPSNKTIQICRYNSSQPKSLSDNNISALFIDRAGVLWIGTSNGGLNKFLPTTAYFESFTPTISQSQTEQSTGIFTSLTQTRDTTLWGGTSEGLFFTSIQNISGISVFNNQRLLTSKNSNISDNHIQAVLQDYKGVIWVGTENGLNKFDKKTSRFLVLRHNPLDSSSLSDDFINCLLEDRNHNLWIGTAGGGVNRLDPHTGKITIYKNDLLSPRSLSDNYVFTLFEDRLGNIWIGTSGGLNKFNPETNDFTSYRHDEKKSSSLSDNSILTIYEHSNGDLWIGTFGGGLNRFQISTGQFEHFREKNGFLSDVVYGILEDSHRQLWVSTSRGLVNILFSSQFKNPNYRIFDANNGLSSNEFRKGAFYKGLDGKLYLGTGDGFTTFHPDSIRDNPLKPQIVITSFRIYNQPVFTDSLIHEKKQLRLQYTDNSFSFEVSALDFINPQKNRYAYRLLNFDDRWVLLNSSERLIRYTNLDPGDYVLQVKASNSDGIWNEDGITLHIQIFPPWWKTLWFQLLLTVFCTSAIIVVYKWQIRTIHKRNKKLETLISIRTLEVSEKNTELERLLEEAEKARNESECAYKLLETEHSRKSRELEEARLLQLSMLPKQLPHIQGMDLAFFMRTATEVGGDYYDYRLNGDNGLTLAIGDATGHGVRAGMLVSIVKSNFHATAEFFSVADIAAHIGRNIKRMNLQKMFMCLTVLRYQNGNVEMSGAGMPPALVYRHKTQTVERMRLRGIVLGAVEHFDYQTITMTLDFGDSLLLMSDGLLELFNKDNEELGEERIIERFRLIGDYSANDIIHHLNIFADEWLCSESQHDDIALVVLKKQHPQESLPALR